MSESLFAAKYRDGLSARQIVVNLFREQPYGAVITFTEISAALSDKPVPRSGIYAAAAAAQFELGKRHMRQLVVVNKQGYRVIEPQQHYDLAVSHKRRAGRQLVRSVHVLDSTNRELVDPERLQAIDMLRMVLIDHETRLRDQDARLSRIERLLFSTKDSSKPPRLGDPTYRQPA